MLFIHVCDSHKRRIRIRIVSLNPINWIPATVCVHQLPICAANLVKSSACADCIGIMHPIITIPVMNILVRILVFIISSYDFMRMVYHHNIPLTISTEIIEPIITITEISTGIHMLDSRPCIMSSMFSLLSLYSMFSLFIRFPSGTVR